MKKLLILMTLIFLNHSLIGNDSKIEIEERELRVSNYPCMTCHGNISKVSKQIEDFPMKTPHDKMIFKHHEQVTSCYTCHDKDNMNQLVLQNEKKINYNESYKLCAQCHGVKFRDWENGVHGKQVGSWSGSKYRYTCTSCHNPHTPPFPQMKADKGPEHPWHKKGHDQNEGGH